MRNGIAGFVIVVSSGFACSHQQQKAPTVAPHQPPAPPRTAANASPTAERTCSSDIDCGERQLCIRSRCVDIMPGLPECSTARIHFDFNQADIHPDETTKLQRMGRCLKADQGRKAAGNL
jgi:outer membrane protein OmpA-like peptidoglycan-associated protein